jgi:anti-sigma regulatory factor (Ser/Thr protein kinase)
MELMRKLEVSAEPNQLSVLAEFAARAATDAGLDDQFRQRIELAMDEACSNIIEHAYCGAAGKILAMAEIQPMRQLTLRLVDSGNPFQPLDVPKYDPERVLEHDRIGGLGLFLMRKVMDEVSFEFGVPGVGNRLTMIKRF